MAIAWLTPAQVSTTATDKDVSARRAGARIQEVSQSKSLRPESRGVN
ncbi:hypothetical protein ABIB25_003566 [Nakamurella sp. UYEF19]